MGETIKLVDDPEFTMEIMEAREELEEAQTLEQVEDIRTRNYCASAFCPVHSCDVSTNGNHYSSRHKNLGGLKAIHRQEGMGRGEKTVHPTQIPGRRR